MGILIDSSILIASERGRLDLATHLAGRPDEEFFVSVITASELLHGVHRAILRPAIQARRAAFVEAILGRFPLLDINLEVARAHAGLWADLTAARQIIGPNDLWLAATCLAHGLAITTATQREFARVPGLVVETWHSTT